MPITELLERNATMYPNDVALVEINKGSDTFFEKIPVYGIGIVCGIQQYLGDIKLRHPTPHFEK